MYPRVIRSPMCVPRAASLRRLVVDVTAEVSRHRHPVFTILIENMSLCAIFTSEIPHPSTEDTGVYRKDGSICEVLCSLSIL